MDWNSLLEQAKVAAQTTILELSCRPHSSLFASSQNSSQFMSPALGHFVYFYYQAYYRLTMVRSQQFIPSLMRSTVMVVTDNKKGVRNVLYNTILETKNGQNKCKAHVLHKPSSHHGLQDQVRQHNRQRYPAVFVNNGIFAFLLWGRLDHTT